jgi:hypothetical protein
MESACQMTGLSTSGMSGSKRSMARKLKTSPLARVEVACSIHASDTCTWMTSENLRNHPRNDPFRPQY